MRPVRIQRLIARWRVPRRRGITAVLAMLYLVLFSALALGFFGTVTTSVQIAGNEQNAGRALRASESGMEFMRYHLWNASVPPQTPQEDLLYEVYKNLAFELDGWPNMNGDTVGIDNQRTMISIPANKNNSIQLDPDGSRFRAEVTQHGRRLRVRVLGGFNEVEIARGLQLDYDIAEKASSIFDYGLASRGRIHTKGATWVKGQTDPNKGSVLSAYQGGGVPTVIIDGKGISGSIGYMEGSIPPEYGNNTSIGGETDPAVIEAEHIHKLEDSPEFPTVDTSIFEPFVQQNYDDVEGNVYDNVRIPANSNVTFNSHDVIRGVLWVEKPNHVKFNGNVKIEGVIVADQKEDFTWGDNVLEFSGNGGTKTGVEDLPDEPQFDGLRELTGSFILAPDFDVKLTGNFGAINGSIVADGITVTGNAEATIKGTLIALDQEKTLMVDGSADITIASTGTEDYPAGVLFGEHYFPLPGTYQEVRP